MYFVVLKGAEGFADRMTCLLQAIEYARATSRILVVDWRDPDWADESVDFDTYFEIDGVTSLSINEFCDRLGKDLRFTDVDILPRHWLKHLVTADCTSVIRSDEYQLPRLGEEVPLIISGKMSDFSERCVVLPGVNQRTFRMDTLRSIRASKQISYYVTRYFRLRDLRPGDYDVIHMRAGSKNWFGGRIRRGSPVYDLHNRWDTEKAYQEYLWGIYQHLTEHSEEKQLYYLSDNEEVALNMIRRYDRGCFLEHSMSHVKSRSSCGIHKICAKEAGTTKMEVNYECIRDFLVMINSRFLVGDDASMFSRLALCIKAEGVPFGSYSSIQTPMEPLENP